MSARPSRPRGFTLLELIIASSIMFITIGMASMAFLSQNKNLQAMDMSRVASESSRDALLQLETSLRSAGWGIDPRNALDFKYLCPTAPCRDKTDGPDELVFVSRNPSYRMESNTGTCTAPSTGGGATGSCYWGNAWPVDSANLTATTPTVTITLRANQVLEKGRVVQVMCQGATKPVMLTLSARYSAGASATAVTLTPDTVDSAPYNNLTDLKADNCHGAVTASVFLVDRYRYFVATPNGSPDPWLMLDTGLDLNGTSPATGVDEADWVPIARNVVDMQVAYMVPPTGGVTNYPDANSDWIIGNSGGPEEPAYGSVTVGGTTYAPPTYSTPAADLSRFTKNEANVRGVRVTLTLRSVRTDANRGATWAGDSLDGAENRTTPVQIQGRKLYTAQTQVSLRNMESRSNFTF
ncbi:prepilin-type N-terminal cleavage/methylation domain-containing protein [Aggregicoccus sp. 17bor-14]|uniref:prepilin-type N-terminal cleavage/methylation domain-containing protein n=1 Tax=Myxococcaceae TaxID=31 RepID=UPI00129D1CDD|nr:MULTISPECIES: prepilin-type N-terminal cleavage/methylation domain-containing protein [Myxococcaceae]MBF5042811.1 prepilin-type N-terminal cleavage/methylation domain-containing protein [Simulacricoccus sp. 17bor-14]MRI88579.1 prepilin-type N-terminal cleavage/methylation domain-containing protein [Aggregicoccus sp. 17bor-14]